MTNHRTTTHSRPTLTLLHGGWLDSRAWNRHVEDLSRGMTVLAPDLRGYGRGATPGAPGGISGWADDVVDLWDAAGVRQGYLLGFSMGGMVALELATRAPERLAGLILMSTTARADAEVRSRYRALAEGFDEQRFEAVLRGHVENAFSPRFRSAAPEYLDEYRSMAAETPLLTMRDSLVSLADGDYIDRLPAITVPTLVVHGTADAVMGGEQAKRLVSAIPGAAERVFEGGGHTLHLETPGEVTDVIRSFVSSIEESEAQRVASASGGARSPAPARTTCKP